MKATIQLEYSVRVSAISLFVPFNDFTNVKAW